MSRALGTPRQGGGGTPRSKSIPDGPILDFCSLIEETPTEEWKIRIESFENLVSMIPTGSTYTDHGPAWYNTPSLLRHLAISVSDLLKDARSTVVKRVCEQLANLFTKCQTDARYLFKDIMPTILSVHAQTVQVIRTAVQHMVVETIPQVPCKMVMPLWMERLKVDKSRTVREACALYLGQALQAWTTEADYLTQEIWMQVGTTLVRSLRDPSPHVRNHAKAALDTMRTQQETYWEHLIQDPQGPAAKDPKLKKWLLAQGGDVDVSVAEDLSVASRFSYNSDTRFVAAMRGPSTPSFLRASPRRGLTQQYNNHQHSDIRRTQSTESTSDEEEARVPLSIAVKKTAPVRSSRLGPPLRPKPVVTTTAEPSFEGTPPRVPTATTHAPQPLEPIVDYSHTEGEDPLVPTTTTEAVPSPRFPANLMGDFADMSLQQQEQDEPNITTSPTAAEADVVAPVSSDKEEEDQQPTEGPQTAEEEDYQPPTTIVSSPPAQKEESSKTESAPITVKDSNANASPLTTSAAAAKTSPSPVRTRSPSDGPFSVSMQKLKEHAMKRRSRNSMLMQQRFRMSSSGLGSSVHLEDDDSDEHDNDDDAHKKTTVAQKRSEEENVVPNAKPTRPPQSPALVVSSPPEHMVIAIRLLRAHKLHVDRIMETLKMEMDSLRDFDRLLEEAGRPTEEETLDYFESVGLCLDQRSQANANLQHELDRISRGEPPEEDDVHHPNRVDL